MRHSGDRDLYQLAERVGRALHAAGRRLATAESCTAGWIAKALTDVPGSSQWFECGYVTYSNAAKMRDLGVAASTLQAHGAVSEATVRAMADGARRISKADFAVAVSGVAGPGGSADKPAGTVWFAVAGPERVVCEGCHFAGDRERVRWQSVAHALTMVEQALAGQAPAGRGPSRRLFFALWPDKAERLALAAAALEAVRASGGRPVPADNLHLTLAFLGAVEEQRIPGLAGLAHGVRSGHQGSFVLRLESLERWAHPQVLCAVPQQPPEAAASLAQALRDPLQAAGFAPDFKPFRPHVTVARQVMRPSPQTMSPVEWRCSSFALIESRTLPSGAAYSVVETYPL